MELKWFPRFSKRRGLKDNLKQFVFAIIQLGDSIVTILTLGFMITDWKMKAILSEYFD